MFLNQMKPFSLMLPTFHFIHLQLLLFTLNLIWFRSNTSVVALENQTDHLTLLKFKESISNDPYGILVSWNRSTHFCNWHGITCDPVHRRVTELNLRGYKLQGSISPHVGNLSILRNLYLGNNFFNGRIPQEIGRLSQLQRLYLTNNSLTGEIPTNLTSCSDLKVLDLQGNKLIGKIPPRLFSLRKLQIFSAAANNLTGGISPFIANLSSLTVLSITVNSLEGHIPQEICRLKNLTMISLGVNRMSGALPSCVYNMSSLTILSFPQNQFHGFLPSNLFHTLPNIQVFLIGNNQISGPIPNSLANASSLQLLDIGLNQFVGQVPSLGKLQQLEKLFLQWNNLGTNSSNDLEFLNSLTNCSTLQQVIMVNNNFGGSLPNSLGNLSTRFSQLHLSYNQISGKIPAGVGSLNSLIALSLDHNNFDGIVPASFGKLQMMQSLNLMGNMLSGDIPPFIGNLSRLFRLGLAQNMFEGNILPSIGNCQRLQLLDLSQNSLTGTIPSEVFGISSLTLLLDLSHNSLNGRLPNEVGRLKNIGQMDVSENRLSGDIPLTIGECMSLEYLNLRGNSFGGFIPSSLASLKGLRWLDLSRNNLSGPIPEALQNISILEYLNVSFNMMEGKVPIEGVCRNSSALSLTGNGKLCGGVPKLHLPPCLVKDTKPAKHRNFRMIGVIIGMIAFLLVLSFISTIYWMKKRNKKPSSDSPTIDRLPKVSYKDLHQGTSGFSVRNLIGSGSFACVYKGAPISEDSVVAIKVLNLEKKGAHKSFIAECNALKNIRHRNLVKILTCYSSTDYKGQEFKALVFEYMTNGSLEDWLHPRIIIIEYMTNGSLKDWLHPRTLSLNQRLSIIIDVASALHYLHHEYEQQIVHCDLKPSNVLLDDEMVAHVSDFGMARLLSIIYGTSHTQTSTTGIKGTIGYAPPEYGMGSKMSIHGDMYTFGILTLETITGRRPTDEMFEDSQNLHEFVGTSFPHNLLNILDPSLMPRNEATIEVEDNRVNLDPNVEKCLVSLLKIGLACSVESPTKRMNILDVTRELNIIKRTFCNPR